MFKTCANLHKQELLKSKPKNNSPSSQESEYGCGVFKVRWPKLVSHTYFFQQSFLLQRAMKVNKQKKNKLDYFVFLRKEKKILTNFD